VNQNAPGEYGQRFIMVAQARLPGSQSIQCGQSVASSQPQPQVSLKGVVFVGQSKVTNPQTFALFEE